jgi:mannose-1-phosphate guanylyltransferase
MAVGILLVGGFGTRLMPLTRDTPKPMLPIAGLPVTEHQIAMAKKAGVTHLVLATSYLSEVFTPYFGDGSKWGIKLSYAVEETPLGTGGAIRNAAKLLGSDQPIVILNGDVLSAHNLTEQISQHVAHDADVTLHLTHVDDARAYGCVPLDSQGRVTAFLEKMDNPVANTINAGCYVFKPSVIEMIPDEQVVSIERDTFPALVRTGGSVYGYVEDEYWLDIGTPAALLKGSADFTMQLSDKGFGAGPSTVIAADAQLSGGTFIGENTQVRSGAKITGSIVGKSVIVGQDATIDRCFVADGTLIAPGSHCQMSYVANDLISPLNL